MRRELIAALMLSIVTVSYASANETDITAPHSWRFVGNKICFDEHTHVGGADGRTKRAAHKAAIREWREFTAWEYGSVWANYRRASNKIVSYTKAKVGWSARVEALPCHLRKRRRSRSRRR